MRKLCLIGVFFTLVHCGGVSHFEGEKESSGNTGGLAAGVAGSGEAAGNAAAAAAGISAAGGEGGSAGYGASAAAAGASAAGHGASGTAGSGAGSGPAGNGGSGVTAGAPGQCGAGPSSPVTRPTTCPLHGTSSSSAEGGAASCSTDADCQPGLSGAHCLNGACGLDECLTDSDCPDGQACACGTQVGLTIPSNSCISAGCRVDADCADGACSVSSAGYCHRVDGVYCHTSSDTCQSDADCCGSTPVCAYQSTLGHWACQAYPVCAG